MHYGLSMHEVLGRLNIKPTFPMMLLFWCELSSLVKCQPYRYLPSEEHEEEVCRSVVYMLFVCLFICSKFLLLFMIPVIFLFYET